MIQFHNKKGCVLHSPFCRSLAGDPVERRNSNREGKEGDAGETEEDDWKAERAHRFPRLGILCSTELFQIPEI